MPTQYEGDQYLGLLSPLFGVRLLKKAVKLHVPHKYDTKGVKTRAREDRRKQGADCDEMDDSIFEGQAGGAASSYLRSFCDLSRAALTGAHMIGGLETKEWVRGISALAALGSAWDHGYFSFFVELTSQAYINDLDRDEIMKLFGWRFTPEYLVDCMSVPGAQVMFKFYSEHNYEVGTTTIDHAELLALVIRGDFVSAYFTDMTEFDGYWYRMPFAHDVSVERPVNNGCYIRAKDWETYFKYRHSSTLYSVLPPLLEFDGSASGCNDVDIWTTTPMVAQSGVSRIGKTLLALGTTMLLSKVLRHVGSTTAIHVLSVEATRNSHATILDVASAVVNSLLTWDFATAFSVMRKYMFGAEGVALEKLSIRLLQANMMNNGVMRTKMELEKILAEACEIETHARVTNDVQLAQVTKLFVADVKTKLASVTSQYESTRHRVEPLGIFCCGDAGKGKSTVFHATLAAYGSANGLTTDQVKACIYQHPLGSSYYEGAKGKTIFMMDEAGSIATEIDDTIGEHCAMMLNLVTPLNTPLNQAFEGKGEVYNSFEVCQINSNCEPAEMAKHFTKHDAFYRRFFFVTPEPRERVTTGGKFDPTKLPTKTVSAFNSVMNYKVYRMKSRPHGEPEVIPVGDFSYVGLVKFLADNFKERQSGMRGVIGDLFEELSEVRVNVGGSGETVVSYSDRMEHKEELLAGVPLLAKFKPPPLPDATDVLLNGAVEFGVVSDSKIRRAARVFKNHPLGAKMTAALATEEVQPDGRKKLDKSSRDAITLHGVRNRGKDGPDLFVAQSRFTKGYQSKFVRKFVKGFTALLTGDVFRQCVSESVNSSLDEVEVRIGRVVNDLSARFKEAVVTVAKFVAAALGAYATYRLVQHMTRGEMQAQGLTKPKTVDEMTQGSQVSAETREWAGRLYSIAETPGLTRNFVKFSTNFPESMVSKLTHNMMSVEVTGIRKASSAGWVVKGFGITTAHSFLPKCDSYTVVVQNGNLPRGVTKFQFKESDLTRFGDIVVFRALSLSGIKHMSVINAPSRKLKEGDAMMMVAYGARPALTGRFIKYCKQDYTYSPKEYVGPQSGFVVHWDGTPEAGDCARPVFCVEGGYELHGIHAAHNDSSEESFALSWPGMDALLPKMEGQSLVMNHEGLSFTGPYMPEAILVEEPRHGVTTDGHAWIASNGVIAGSAPNARGSKSQFVESEVCGECDERLGDFRYVLAPLSKQYRFDDSLNANRLVSPFEVMTDYSGIPVGTVPFHAFESFIAGVDEHVSRRLDPSIKCRVLGLDDALKAHGEFKAVAVGTGSGMPEGGKKKDFLLYDPVGGDTVAGDRLREHSVLLCCKLMDGQVPLGMGNLVPKDEQIKVSKFDSMTVRGITCVAFPEYALTRQFFMDPLSVVWPLLQSSFGFCLRVNMLSRRDVQAIFDRSVANRGGDRVPLAADFERFDKHHFLIALFAAFELLARWILRLLNHKSDSPVGRVVVGLLWMALRRLTKVDGAWIFMFFGGPSGHFLTVYFNCMCQLFYWFLTWNELVGGTFDEFMSDVGNHLSELGDDVAMSLPKEVTVKMPSHEIVRCMRDICGQKITGSGDKGALEYGGSFDFLKRRFVEIDGRIFAHLSEKTVYKAFRVKPLGGKDNKRWRNMLEAMWCESLIMPAPEGARVRGFLELCSEKLNVDFSRMEWQTFVDKFDEGDHPFWE